MRTRQQKRSQRQVLPRYESKKVRNSTLSTRLVVDLGGDIVDLTELDLPSTMKTNFPDPTDLLNFTLTITPDEGVHTI
jgi:hypothetical protein